MVAEGFEYLRSIAEARTVLACWKERSVSVVHSKERDVPMSESMSDLRIIATPGMNRRLKLARPNKH